MLRTPSVLLLSNAEAEADTAVGLFGQAASVTPVRSLSELKEKAGHSPYDALLCGWSFHRRHWKNAVRAIRIILGDLPVIFLSRSVDASQWKEVLDAGGFDLLLPPFSEFQTLAVLGQAVDSWEARRRHNGFLHPEPAGL